MKLLAIGLVVGILLGTVILSSVQTVARAQDGAAAATAPLQKAAVARMEAAQEVVRDIKLRMEAGEPRTPTTVELHIGAARRLMEAKFAAARDQDEKIAAASEYLQSGRELLKQMQSVLHQDVTRAQLAQAAYQIADAEYVLAELRAQ